MSNNSSSLESGFGAMKLNSGSGTKSGSDSGSDPMRRKADFAYNHVVVAERPGECKVSVRTMGVIANYFSIVVPKMIQAHCYRVELSTKGRAGWEPMIKRDKAEPLFWSLYQQRPQIFPRNVNRLLFNGVDAIYSLDRLNIVGGDQEIAFPVHPPSRTAQGGNGRAPRPVPQARCRIIAVPIIRIEDFFSSNDADRTQTNLLIDLIITHEMRCPLIQRHSRFVQQGHSLFRVPTDVERERHQGVYKIGMGEEVWTGLHMAVKEGEDNQLYLNAATSHSIYYVPKLSLVDFYAEVVHGYRMEGVQNKDRLTIDPQNVAKLTNILTGKKVLVLQANGAWKTKKFDGITMRAATQLSFDYNGTEISVAEYYAQFRQIRLEYPNLPCLKFKNRSNQQPVYIPMEVCTTNDEPKKYQGTLSSNQLNAFIKAVGMAPMEKKRLIDNLISGRNGSYLGDGTAMEEWGIGVNREMIEIKNPKILPLPNMQFQYLITRVNEITGEYAINDELEPRKLIEPSVKPLALVTVFVNEKRENEKDLGPKSQFFASTLRGFGIDVVGPAFVFQYLLDDRGNVNGTGLKEMIAHWIKEVSSIGQKQKREFVPLFLFVFPRKDERLYASVKATCDVEFGVLSQVLLKRTFDKFFGNEIKNSSAQNVLLKVVAKAGGVACRIDGDHFKNMGKMTTSTSPVLVLGIDVSHPSREERMDALKRAGMTPDKTKNFNKSRGRHEQLATSRPAASNLIKELPADKCPRSVVSVVGNVNLLQTKWGVSSRMQRVGQEESVNLVEPFKERIQEFTEKTGYFPKHLVVYRDGISDSMFKKTLYEETEALERAVESLQLNPEKDEKVTITYIVAKKRHHTRFFAANPEEAIDAAGKPGGNTPPGLLVETTITSRHSFDFFLQSHYGNIGTASPTHYTVLRDDWKPSQSFWQTVVFAHCFGNARCTRPLSLPIPLHYAHFAAKRAKILFDHYRDYASPEEYRKCREELVREEMEKHAITVNDKLREINSMFFA